jgi:hypothetical protein
MEIKKRIESHPITYLLVSAVSVSTIAVGVAEYFCRQRIDIANQKSELRISTLESDLTSIKRGMGENKYLDIRSFVCPKDRFALLQPSQKAKYDSDDGFYAIFDLPGWKYKKTTVEKFIRELGGEEMPPASKQLIGKNPVHTWDAVETLTVKGPNDFSESGPTIFLEKTPNAALMNFKKEDFSKLVREVTGAEMKPDEVPDLSELERVYRGDVATIYLASFMRDHLRQFIGFPEIDTQLVELQKVGNVVYSQVLITVQNATVNDKKLPVFYVRFEEIIITDQNATTVIGITIPSADPAPRGTAYAQIQEWFSGLAIRVG